jgi:hypothetical protein
VILVFRQSRLFGPRRETLRVHPDRIEHAKPGFVGRTRTVTVRYEHVAEVVLDRRLVWSSIQVETTGGGGIVIHGLRRRLGELAKGEIDDRVNAVHAKESLAEALERLGRLKAEGLLTPEEFAAAKQTVFKRAA